MNPIEKGQKTKGIQFNKLVKFGSLDLNFKVLGPQDTIALVQSLQNTQVHTLKLGGNAMGQVAALIIISFHMNAAFFIPEF